MARLTGRLINLGIGKEATRGTAVAPTFWLPKVELDFDDKDTKVLDDSSLGVIEKNSDAHVIKQWGEGHITGNVHRNSFGLILAALFGQAPTSTQNADVSGTVYDHSFARANNNSHLSLTLAAKDSNQDLRFAMAMLDSLKIDMAVDKYITFEATFRSKGSASASDTVTYVSESKFIPKHASMKTAAVGSSNLDAASALTDIKSISLEFKKNVEDIQSLGSVDLFDIHNDDFEATCKIEKFYNDTTFKDYWSGNTHRSLRIDLTDTDTTIGTAANPELKIDFEEVVFTDWMKGMGNSSIVTETVTMTGLFSQANSKMVSAVLTNDTASY